MQLLYLGIKVLCISAFLSRVLSEVMGIKGAVKAV
jgi:hypothetical protein